MMGKGCCHGEKGKNHCGTPGADGKNHCGSKGGCGSKNGCGSGCGSCFSPKKMFKILIAGVLYTIIAQVAGMAVWGGIFQETVKSNMHLWRPENSPEMLYGMIIANLITGMALACIYKKFSKGLHCHSPVSKGAIFGFKIWLVLGLGQGIGFYSFSPVPPEIMYAIFVHQAIANIVGGIVIALVMKKKGGCGTGSCGTGDHDGHDHGNDDKDDNRVIIQPKPKM